jgi:hypothetical protein
MDFHDTERGEVSQVSRLRIWIQVWNFPGLLNEDCFQKKIRLGQLCRVPGCDLPRQAVRRVPLLGGGESRRSRSCSGQLGVESILRSGLVNGDCSADRPWPSC